MNTAVPIHSSRLTAGRTLLLAIVALVLGALMAAGLAVPAAHAAGPSSVTVSITNKLGMPVTGLSVSAVPVSDAEEEEIEGFETSPGKYRVEELAATSTWTVRVTSAPDSYFGLSDFVQYYGGGYLYEQAKTLQLSGGESAVTMSVASSGSIAGKVTNWKNVAQNLAFVRLFRFDGDGWALVGVDITEANGTFSFRGLDPGSYKVGALTGALFGDDDGSLEAFNGGATSLDDAKPVYVIPGKATTITLKTVLGGVITGKAVNAAGQPIRDVTAVAMPLEGNPIDGFTGIDYDGASGASDSTTADGRWKVGSLPTGFYIVQLRHDGEPSLYKSTFVSDTSAAENWYDARLIAVTATKTVDAGNSTMPDRAPGSASINVLVLDPNGHAIDGAYVSLDSLGDDNASYADYTGTNGRFGQSGLLPGEYWLYVDASEADTGFELDVYDDVVSLENGSNPFVITLEEYVEGTPFELTAPTTLTNGDTPLVGTTYSPEVSVSGNVDFLEYQWLRDGMPIFGARSEAYTARAGDVGTLLSVHVSIYAWESDESIETSVAVSGPITEAPAPTLLSAPEIMPLAGLKVGARVTAHPGFWSSGMGSYSYRWLRGGVPIAKATASTYVLTAADVARDLQVEVSYARSGYAQAAPALSAAITVPAYAAPKLTKAPVIGAKNLSDGVVQYTAAPGTWSVTGLAFSYDWYLGSSLEASGTSFSYQPAADDLPVTLVTHASKSQYTTASVTRVVHKSSVAPVMTSGAVINGYSGQVGSPEFGSVLSAVPAVFSGQFAGPAARTTDSLQWLRNGVAIPGATAATYRPTLADLGRPITIRSVQISTVQATAWQLSAAVTVVPNTALESNPASVAVAGTGAPGVPLKGWVGLWPGTAKVVQTYQWFSCSPPIECGTPGSGVPIPGATSLNYTPKAAETGRTLTLHVTGSKPGFVSATVLSPSIVVGDPATITLLTPPTLTGVATVGRSVAVKPGSYDIPGVTRSYTWSSCAAACTDDESTTIVSGKSAAFIPTASLAGSTLRVTETVGKVGYLPTVTIVGSWTVEPGSLAIMKASTLASSTTTFTVTPGTSKPAANVDVRWFVDGSLDSSGLTLPRGDHPQSVIVAEVRHQLSGYKTATQTIVAQRGLPPVVGESVTITGDPRVGGELTAPTPFEYTGTVAAEAVRSYQWYSGSTAIAKATAATYRPVAADLGKAVSVRVASKSASYPDATYRTQPVTVLVGAAWSSQSELSITAPSEFPKPGAVLSVNRGGDSAAGYAFSYQWQVAAAGASAWSVIPKATKASYNAALADAGKRVRVVLTAKKAGHSTAVVASAAVTISEVTILGLVSSPTISGPGKVGTVLKATPGIWVQSGVAFRYEWLRNGVAIPGANASTLTLASGYYLDEFTVRVTGTKLGFFSTSAESRSMHASIGDAPLVVAGKGPKLTGTAKVGTTLTVSPGLWNLDGLAITVAWYSGGVLIADAHETTFVPIAAQAGAVISAKVTAQRPGYAPAVISLTGAVVAP